MATTGPVPTSRGCLLPYYPVPACVSGGAGPSVLVHTQVWEAPAYSCNLKHRFSKSRANVSLSYSLNLYAGSEFICVSKKTKNNTKLSYNTASRCAFLSLCYTQVISMKLWHSDVTQKPISPGNKGRWQTQKSAYLTQLLI